MTTEIAPGVDLPDSLVAAYAHEIGHAAVALWAGCEVIIEVEFSMITRHFEGVCHVRHPAGDLPGCVLRPLGLAGVVAEQAYRFGGLDSPPLSVEALGNALRDGQLDISGTDLQMADGWSDEDLALAIEIVSDRWPWIVSEAESRAREANGDVIRALGH